MLATEKVYLLGNAFFVRLHDIYAVDLTLHYGTIKVELYLLSQFNPKSLLLLHKINAYIGQTLLFSATPLFALQERAKLVDACKFGCDRKTIKANALSRAKVANG